LPGIRAASCRHITSAKKVQKKNKTLMKQKLIAKKLMAMPDCNSEKI
jgi:ribose 5-phosphate isomerase RpiB